MIQLFSTTDKASDYQIPLKNNNASKTIILKLLNAAKNRMNRS